MRMRQPASAGHFTADALSSMARLETAAASGRNMTTTAGELSAISYRADARNERLHALSVRRTGGIDAGVGLLERVGAHRCDEGLGQCGELGVPSLSILAHELGPDDASNDERSWSASMTSLISSPIFSKASSPSRSTSGGRTRISARGRCSGKGLRPVGFRRLWARTSSPASAAARAASSSARWRSSSTIVRTSSVNQKPITRNVFRRRAGVQQAGAHRCARAADEAPSHRVARTARDVAAFGGCSSSASSLG
jgi:hypothetical protein